MNFLQNQRVLVMGLGRFGGGVGVARFLAQRGARVLVTDMSPAGELAQSVAQLDGLPVAFRLGEHRIEDFTSADLVVVNPAVERRSNPYLQAAAAAGVPLTSEIRLLIQSLPNRRRTIGITGSAGKSTTTAMIGHVLQGAFTESNSSRVWVGGNIGGSLLGQVQDISPQDWVVLELSSFMLEDLAGWSPHIAVVTNLAANHLDRHGSLDAYAAAKAVILQDQTAGDCAILGPGVERWVQPRVADVVRVEADRLRLPGELLVPGAHNRLNAAMALAVASRCGVDAAAAAESLASFAGLPHRLQFVCEHAGVRYFNDSKATTPEAAALALRSFPPGVVHAILGGYDKKSDLGALARLAASHCRALYSIGATGDAIATAAQAQALDLAAVYGPAANFEACASAGGEARRAQVIRAGTLDRALAETLHRVHAGDVVLLSPGCASWDQFDNFEQRGARFVEAVLKYAGEGTPPRLTPDHNSSPRQDPAGDGGYAMREG